MPGSCVIKNSRRLFFWPCGPSWGHGHEDGYFFGHPADPPARVVRSKCLLRIFARAVGGFKSAGQWPETAPLRPILIVLPRKTLKIGPRCFIFDHLAACFDGAGCDAAKSLKALPPTGERRGMKIAKILIL